MSDEQFMAGLCLAGNWKWQKVGENKHSVTLHSGSVVIVTSCLQATKYRTMETIYTLTNSHGESSERSVGWPDTPRDSGISMTRVVWNW
jgi:hypothetical protein